jgi:hypothetical protein
MKGSWTCCAVGRAAGAAGRGGRHACRRGAFRRWWAPCRTLAAVGRLPLVRALAISGPPPAVDAASAVRAKDLLYRTALVSGASFTGPVLPVDNTIRTRWTATEAAALLADAGATSVLPLTIHHLP